jgi:hypothetical protein
MSSSDPPAAATVLEVMLGAGKATALVRAGHTVLGEKPRIKSALFRVRLLLENARACRFVRDSAHFAAA